MDSIISVYLRTIERGKAPQTGYIVYRGVKWGQLWFPMQKSAEALGNFIDAAGYGGLVDPGDGSKYIMVSVEESAWNLVYDLTCLRKPQ